MKRAMIVWLLACACACGAQPKPQPAPPPSAPPPEPVEAQPPPPPPPPPPRPASLTGVAECDLMIATYEKLFDCDQIKKLPPESQDAMRQGLQSMKDGMHFDNDAARDAAKPGCLQALDGVKQAAQAMGCAP